MRINVILVAMAILAISCKQKLKNYTELVGLTCGEFEYFLETDGYTKIGGVFIGNYDSAVFTVNKYKKDSVLLILLIKDSDESSSSIDCHISDIISINGINEQEERIEFAMCRLNGIHDSELFARCRVDQNSKMLTKVSMAWRVNPLVGKIESITTDGIGCVNISYGND